MDLAARLADIKRLNLDTDSFMIVSSGSLAIRGIREARDLDIIVTPAVWKDLSERFSIIEDTGVERIQLNDDIEILNPEQSWYGNKSPIPMSELFAGADMFDGIRFMNLGHLRRVKQVMGRGKDLQDIRLIDAYLSST